MSSNTLTTLRKLSAKDSDFKNTFEFLASYVKSRWITRADDLVNAGKCSYPNAVTVLRELAELGLGTFVVGRRGRRTRLEWNRHPATTAKAVLDPTATALPSSIHDDDESILDEESADFEDAGRKTFIDEYKLRHDFVVKVLLPADLTRDEATRLADHVRTMYFSSAA